MATVPDMHVETALQRTRRDLHSAFHSTRFVLGVLLADALLTAAAVAGARHHSIRVQALLAVASVVGGTAVMAFLVGTWLLVRTPARQRNEARAELVRQVEQREEMLTQLSWDQFLYVGIKKTGATLKSVAINVVVPATADHVVRVGRDGNPAPSGTQLKTAETLVGDVPSIYWEESGLTVHGFGTSTIMKFAVGLIESRELPVKFKIGCEELGGWAEWSDVVRQSPPPVPTRLRPTV